MGVHMSKHLVIWDSAAVPNACVLHQHSEIEDPWELVEGVPRAATFPACCSGTARTSASPTVTFTTSTRLSGT